MNFSDFEDILPSLQDISVETGKYQIKNHKEILEIRVKENQTPVTDIDITSSNMIEIEILADPYFWAILGSTTLKMAKMAKNAKNPEIA